MTIGPQRPFPSSGRETGEKGQLLKECEKKQVIARRGGSMRKGRGKFTPGRIPDDKRRLTRQVGPDKSVHKKKKKSHTNKAIFLTRDAYSNREKVVLCA